MTIAKAPRTPTTQSRGFFQSLNLNPQIPNP